MIPAKPKTVYQKQDKKPDRELLQKEQFDLRRELITNNASFQVGDGVETDEPKRSVVFISNPEGILRKKGEK